MAMNGSVLANGGGCKNNLHSLRANLCLKGLKY